MSNMKSNPGHFNPMRLLASCILLAFASTAFSESTLFKGGDVYTVSDGVKPGIDVLVIGGKISAIGANLAAGDAKIVEVSGKRIYPGLIHASTLAGLTELGSVRASNDYAETGQVNPNALAASAINPDSELLPVIRGFGVTTLHVMPMGGQSVLSGTSAAIQTRGWTIEDMAIAPAVGIVVQWPNARAPDFLPPMIKDEVKKQAELSAAALKRAFEQATAYGLAKASDASGAQDLKLAALLPALAGKQSVFINASESVQIREALDFCAALALRCVLVGAHDAWRYADAIKAAKIEVILGSPFDLPLRRSDSYDVNYTSAAKLAAAGIKFAIAGDGSSFSAPLDGNLAFNAAQYQAFGLSSELALRAITLSAAEVLGIADKVGSISVGKQADLLIASGDVMEITSTIEAVYINGELQENMSRHTRLGERFRGKLKQ